MHYLAIHDQEMLWRAMRVRRQYTNPTCDMRRHIRKTIGETHWRRYLDFYRHYRKNRRERIKIEPTEVHSAAPPPLPTLSKVLNADVTSAIFSFLDGKSMYEASKVSRSFRDALVPRQRNVTMAGFPSVKAFRRMNFKGMEYFSGGRSDLITDDVLSMIADDHVSYPKLERVEAGHCRNLTLDGECDVALGPRLEKLSTHHISLE